MWNIMSSTKPEVRNVSHCCQRMTDRRQKEHLHKIWWYLDEWFFKCEQTDIQTMLIAALCPPIPPITGAKDQIYYWSMIIAVINTTVPVWHNICVAEKPGASSTTVQCWVVTPHPRCWGLGMYYNRLLCHPPATLMSHGLS